MKNKKISGSFYTPEIIAEFLVDYLAEKLKSKKGLTIIEPSAGDGKFIDALYKHRFFLKEMKRVIAIEKDLKELNKILHKHQSKSSLLGLNKDFLEYQENSEESFSLVIGNPPYIKKNLLDEKQIEYCKKIHHDAALSQSQPKNLWTAFLVRCIRFTSSEGILAFVLPSELLQVKFAKELRSLLTQGFERIEIFTFNELLFKDCKGQDTLLLIGERQSTKRGTFYCNISNLKELKNRQFVFKQNIDTNTSKWTHLHLQPDEFELLEKLKLNLKTIGDFCSSKVGIVTGANDFFIINASIVGKYSLHKYVKPIILRAPYVGDEINFTTRGFQKLSDTQKSCYLIALEKDKTYKRNEKIWDYLKEGTEKKINEGYKTSLRDRWFEIPNIGLPPEGFFFRRCNGYPKLIKNSARILSTDCAYVINMKGNYNIESLIFSFYNSLTLAFTELNGRYYGGGVLELTPNEFKELPVPYIEISSTTFDLFVSEFRKKNSIEDILNMNDRIILTSIIKNIDEETIQKVSKIRQKLFLRRNKQNL